MKNLFFLFIFLVHGQFCEQHFVVKDGWQVEGTFGRFMDLLPDNDPVGHEYDRQVGASLSFSWPSSVVSANIGSSDLMDLPYNFRNLPDYNAAIGTITKVCIEACSKDMSCRAFNINLDRFRCAFLQDVRHLERKSSSISLVPNQL
ncbi:hypothetical protein SNEBB_007629 [Seison nebaliae]|nr:hypothetical protein SNEBB_007629 [Seison nebaliae]